MASFVYPSDDPSMNEEFLETLYNNSDDIIDYEPEELEFEPQPSDQLQEPSQEDLPSEQFQPPPGAAQDSIPVALYGCWIVLSIREFKGQSSGKDAGRWGVSGESVDQFIQNCWKISSKFLKREVVFESKSGGPVLPYWSEKSVPDESDFSKFAIFSDKTAKRNLRPDQLTDSVLQNWRNKEIHLFLHIYSTSVNSKAVHGNVQDILFTKGKGSTDRSGAPSNAVIDGISKRLREVHECWEAQDIVWTMWANAICVAEPHLQEELIYDVPPSHLTKLFSQKEAPKIQAINRNFSMAHSVNQGFQDDVAAVRRSYDQIKKVVLNLLEAMKLMDKNLECLELRGKMGDSFITAAEQAVLVEESEFSASLASKVGDCEDTDHL